MYQVSYLIPQLSSQAVLTKWNNGKRISSEYPYPGGVQRIADYDSLDSVQYDCITLAYPFSQKFVLWAKSKTAADKANALYDEHEIFENENK